MDDITQLKEEIKQLKDELKEIKMLQISNTSERFLQSSHVIQVKKPKSWFSKSFIFVGGVILGGILGYTYSTSSKTGTPFPPPPLILSGNF
jgi:F0F1-type ATP synthase assembly protein I